MQQSVLIGKSRLELHNSIETKQNGSQLTKRMPKDLRIKIQESKTTTQPSPLTRRDLSIESNETLLSDSPTANEVFMNANGRNYVSNLKPFISNPEQYRMLREKVKYKPKGADKNPQCFELNMSRRYRRLRSDKKASIYPDSERSPESPRARVGTTQKLAHIRPQNLIRALEGPPSRRERTNRT